MTEPLWLRMENAFLRGRQPGHNDRFGYAAEIKTLADWLVQEESVPPSGDDWPLAYAQMRVAKWECCQVLRARLLEQARIAREGEA